MVSQQAHAIVLYNRYPMTSFLIISPEQKKRDAYLVTFYETHAIDKFDRTIITRETSKNTTQSIGLETIKQMQKKLFLKPIKSKSKAVILEEAHLLTTEAQNALLKVLEEPPENTLIVLSAESKEALLPTILSRCQIIELQMGETKLTAKEQETITAFLEALPTMPAGEKLKKAELLAKDKEKAAMWVGKALTIIRTKMITNMIVEKETLLEEDHIALTKMKNQLHELQSLYTLLKTTNVNARFAIEVTLLTM